MGYDPENILEKIYFTEDQDVMEILVHNAAHFMFLLKLKAAAITVFPLLIQSSLLIDIAVWLNRKL